MEGVFEEVFSLLLVVSYVVLVAYAVLQTYNGSDRFPVCIYKHTMCYKLTYNASRKHMHGSDRLTVNLLVMN